MPRDALYEESAQPERGKSQSKWYSVFMALAIVFAAMALIQLFVILLVLPAMTEGLSGWSLALFILIWVLPCVACAATGFIFFRLRLRFNVSYDYIFVQDELRITKVFNGRKRKHLVTLHAEHMLQIGYCEGDAFERTLAGMNGAKPKVMSPNREPAAEKDFIHILYSDSMGKVLYVIECRKEMLEYLVLAAGRNKFVRK